MRSSWSCVCTGAAVLLALTSCGGGGGSSSGGSAPAAAATAAPTLTPGPAGSTFSLANSPFRLGQAAPGAYVVLGYAARAASGPFDDIVDPATVDGSIPLAMRLASATDLRVTLGPFGEGSVVPNGGGGITSAGQVVQLGFSTVGGDGSLGVIYGPQARVLASSAHLYWLIVDRPADPNPLYAIALVYGVATPAAEVPRDGIARYVGAATVDAIEVDFASGAVTGTLARENASPIMLQNVALTADRTGFTGRVATADGAVDTMIEARFTGPGAGELIFRFVHPPGSGKPAAVGGLVRMS